MTHVSRLRVHTPSSTNNHQTNDRKSGARIWQTTRLQGEYLRCKQKKTLNFLANLFFRACGWVAIRKRCRVEPQFLHHSPCASFLSVLHGSPEGNPVPFTFEKKKSPSANDKVNRLRYSHNAVDARVSTFIICIRIEQSLRTYSVNSERKKGSRTCANFGQSPVEPTPSADCFVLLSTVPSVFAIIAMVPSLTRISWCHLRFGSRVQQREPSTGPHVAPAPPGVPPAITPTESYAALYLGGAEELKLLRDSFVDATTPMICALKHLRV
jgi:hypothetical protein